MRIHDIIRRPLITEKSTAQGEANIVAFEVDRRANKIEIKRAVEATYPKVVVAEVRVATMHGKERRQGRYVGHLPDWKKAYVRLASGEINLFEGM